MLWEIFEDIKNYIRMTFIPSMRNIRASLRSLVSMLLVMLVLQILLSVICISGVENIFRQNESLEKFHADIEAATVDGADVKDEASGSYATSDSFKTIKNGTSILVGALGIWAICSLAVYQRIASAASDRDKYVWGMYIVHGAKKKKIRAMLKCEMFAPHFLATVAAYPIALYLCKLFVKADYGFNPIALIIVLVLSFLCIRLAVEYECLLIRNMTPTYMLREEDSPKSICYPRKNSPLVKGFTPSRYGRSSFFRMRKYYIALSVVASVPALIWICLIVSAKGETAFLEKNVNEFTIKSEQGLSETELEAIQNKTLDFSDKISSLSASASYDAAGIHTHFLADDSRYSELRYSPYFTTTYADNVLTFTMNDTAFQKYTGFDIGKTPRGQVSIVLPKSGSEYAFSEGDRIFIAISKREGSIRVVNSDAIELLKQDLTEEYEYLELDVARVSTCYDEHLSAGGFLNVKQTYFVLNKEDYEKINSVTNESFSTFEYEYSSAMDGKASFNISFPATEFEKLPEEGDCLELSGKYSGKLVLENVESVYLKEPKTFERQLDETFKYAYINSVSTDGDRVIINVTPQDFITFNSGFGVTVATVALGTPKMTTADNNYFINTCEKDLSFLNGTVTVAGEVTVHTSSRIVAAQTGAHALLPESALNVTDGRLKIDELYANDDFIIAAADKTTSAFLGIDICDVTPKEATLVLPTSVKHYLNFAINDELLLATTLEDVCKYNPNAVINESKYDMLDTQLKNNRYAYVSLLITDIVYSDDAERVHIFVNSEDFSTITAKHGAYTELSVSLTPDITSEEYSQIRNWLGGFVAGDTRLTSISSSGAYLDHLLRENADYSSVILLISIIIPLIIPFVWYYPVSTLFDRRRAEIKILEAVGKRRSQIFASFAAEGVLLAACAFLTVLVMCYPVMLLYKLSCIFFTLPIEFEYSYLSFPILAAGGLAVAICAAVCFAICVVGSLPIKNKK